MLRRLRQWLSAGDAARASPAEERQTPATSARAQIAHELAQRPEDAELNYRMGAQCLAEGDVELALDHFHLALHYAPADFRACAGRAAAQGARGDREQERAAYEEFLDVNPGHAAASYALARWHYARYEYERALELLQALAAREPVEREACNLLGLILSREYGRLDAGERMLRRALIEDPAWPEALSNLGWILMERGDYDRGLAMIEDVLARDPDDHETRLALACMNLKRGAFAAGWRDYEARAHSRYAPPRVHAQPRWRGEPIADKTLLIVGEQGLGDQIMFASCIGEAMQRCRKAIVECDARLVDLFARSFPGARICADARVYASEADVQIPMGSLPALMRARWEDFPLHQGYLRADPARIAYWRARLDRLGPGVKLGISWRGGAQATRRHLRSLDPEQLLRLLPQGTHAINLQYGDCLPELAGLDRKSDMRLVHWPEALDDYSETAALVCALDLVLSVCTAVIHLAGALGRPVWVLAPAVAEWRYMHQGTAMPWYPSARIYRQRDAGDWGPVLGEVEEDLFALIGQAGSDAQRH